MEELLARLRALIRRSTGRRPGTAVRRRRARSAQAAVTVDGAPVKLTSHEFRVLSYLMHHRGRVVPQGELRTHLRAGRRSRLEHGRGLHRATAAKLGALASRPCAASAIASRRARMTRAARCAQFLVGSILWTMGLLGAVALSFVYCSRSTSRTSLRHPALDGPGGRRAGLHAGGLSQVRRGLSPINQLRERLGAVRDGRGRRASTATTRREVQPLVDDLNALLDDARPRCGARRPKPATSRTASRRRSRCSRRRPSARGPRVTPSWRRPSRSRWSGCAGRSTITWRRRARPRRAPRRRARVVRTSATACADAPPAPRGPRRRDRRGGRAPTSRARPAGGPRRDDRQPARQRLQVGAARVHVSASSTAEA